MKNSLWPDPAALSDAVSPHQREQLALALRSRFGLLIGTPGTGKTHTTGALVRQLAEQYGREAIAVVAPTGKAAVRVGEAMRRHGVPIRATTIHTLLEIGRNGHDGDGWGFQRNADCPLDQHFVIVDEASMVDTDLAASLLSACGPRSHVLWVGDPGQLPPVGHGAPLRDMIDAGNVPVGRLSEIRRNAGLIVHACAAIAQGESDWELADKYDPAAGHNLRHIEETTPEGMIDRLSNLLALIASKSAANNWHPLWDVQVIVATNERGDVNRQRLNQALQAQLNPCGDGHARHGFKRGDKVICLRNHFALDAQYPGGEKHYLANGEIGEVIEAADPKFVVGRFAAPARTVYCPMVKAQRDEDTGEQTGESTGGDFDLAYAITAHKCLDPETLVETAEGLLPIRVVLERGCIATPDGPSAYVEKVSYPEGPMLTIKTVDGYALTLTPSHRINRWQQGYQPCMASDLREGDILRLRLGVTVDPPRPAALPPLPSGDIRAFIHPTPSSVTDREALFFGLMVADGCVWNSGFRLLKRHRDVAERFGLLCRQLFDLEPRPAEGLGCTGFEVSSTLLAEWLRYVGGMSPEAKAVPDAILRSPASVQNAFLRGLFEDGTVNLRPDGTPDHIEWTTIYQPLANSVRVMLLRAGIISGTVSRQGCHSVVVYGRNIALFARSIGFVSAWKNSRLLSAVGTEKRYHVPLTKEEAKELRQAVPYFFDAYRYQNARERGRISRQTARLILDDPALRPSPIVLELAERMTYHHSRIASITKTIGPSMCIEVPDGHRFLQNGFDGWNSQGSEWPVVIVMIDASAAARRVASREWLYTAISRARDCCYTIGRHSVMVQIPKRPSLQQRRTLLADLIAGRAVR